MASFLLSLSFFTARMKILLPILIVIPIALAIWVMTIFNRLIRQRNRLREGWSGIDIQLKRRHDLVPNLVECVKSYQEHEKELLEAVTLHRSEAAAADSVGGTMGAENALTSDLNRLLMLAEAYPELKANEQFRELGANLVEIEDDLQYARRYYNGCVRDQNNLVETFPNSMIASSFGFKATEFFELESAAAALPPDLGKLLGKDSTQGEETA